MRGVTLLVVSIGHSFILVAFTLARGFVECDVVDWTTGSMVQLLLWKVVVVDALSSVDESVSVSSGDDGSEDFQQVGQ